MAGAEFRTTNHVTDGYCRTSWITSLVAAQVWSCLGSGRSLLVDNTGPLLSQDTPFSARNSVKALTSTVTGPGQEGPGHLLYPSPHCTLAPGG